MVVSLNSRLESNKEEGEPLQGARAPFSVEAPPSCALLTPGSSSGVGFRVQGLGFGVQGSGFRVQGLGFRVQGSGFRV